jgi:FAM76 protein
LIVDFELKMTIFSSQFQIDGKLLCWLCTLSYKRALTKAKQVESDRRRAKKRPADNSVPVSSAGPTSNNNKSASSANQANTASGGNPSKKPANQQPQRSENNKAPLSEIPEKLAKNGSGGAVGSNGFVDPNSSDHVVAMTNLKETIASLQKKVQQKERELLQKDKEITELKAKNFTSEQELRKAAKETEKRYDLKIELLNKKLSGQLKEIAVLSKSTKNPRGASAISAGSGGSNSSVAVSVGKADKQDSDNTANSSGGSGTESPNTN